MVALVANYCFMHDISFVETDFWRRSEA